MEFASKIWKIIESFLRFIVFNLFRLKIDDDKWEGFIQFVKFGLVGVTNTVISYLIEVISLAIFDKAGLFTGIEIYVAPFIAYLLSVPWSFYWNNKMVFKAKEGEKRNLFSALMKSYVSYAFTSFFLAEVLRYILVRLLGINEYIAPLIGLIVTVPINFLIQKFWAFRKKKEK